MKRALGLVQSATCANWNESASPHSGAFRFVGDRRSIIFSLSLFLSLGSHPGSIRLIYSFGCFADAGIWDLYICIQLSFFLAEIRSGRQILRWFPENRAAKDHPLAFPGSWATPGNPEKRVAPIRNSANSSNYLVFFRFNYRPFFLNWLSWILVYLGLPTSSCWTVFRIWSISLILAVSWLWQHVNFVIIDIISLLRKRTDLRNPSA